MDYNEILLQAIDTVIGSRLQGLSFDKTVKAQIVEDLGNGTYRVKENDTVKYLAIAEGTYSVNEWVYVTIPQGDTSATKIIVGKYTDDLEAEPAAYITELDSFMPLTEAAFSQEKECSFIANSGETNKRQYVQIGSTIILADSSSVRLKYNSAYNTIGVSCKFKTWFNDLEMLSGTYGIQIRMATHDGQVHIADLDSSTMFGDPYNYTTYFDQGCTIDISNLTTIDAIGVYLYQDNNFRYLKDEGSIGVYEFPSEDNAWFGSNIYVKDIKIQLGEDISVVDNHTIKLVSDDASLTYGEEDTTKSVSLIWYNKDSAGRSTGYQDGICDLEYDEDIYAKELEDEYYGGFVKIDGLAPLRDAYACYYKGKQMDTHIEEAKAVLKKVYQNIIRVAVNYYIGAGKTNGQMSILKDDFDWGGGKGYYDQVFLGLVDKYHQGISDWGKELAKLYNNEEDEVEEDTAEDVEWNKLSVLNPDDNLRLASLWIKLVSCLTADKETTGETAYYDQLISLVVDYRKEYNSCGKAIMDCYEGTDEENAGISAKSRYNTCKAAIKSVEDVSKLKTFEEEYEEFKEANKNRYCIYWYKANEEVSDDPWLGDGWERLDGAKYPELDGKEYADYNRPFYQAEMELESSSTSFRGIIFFNHEQFESNTLKFDNTIIQQDMPEDLGTGLVIYHGSNSQGHYQNYGDDYCILQSSDAYQTRQLEVKHNGTEYGNKVFTGNYLFWYVPETLTMISPASPTSAGFAVLKAATTTEQKNMLNPEHEDYDEEYAKLQTRLRDGYTCYYKTVGESEDTEATAADDENWDTEEKTLGEPKASDLQFPYRIKNVYNPSYINNEIGCVLNYGDYDYEAKISFTFSTYGTCGTSYTLAIESSNTTTSINLAVDGSSLIIQPNLLNSENSSASTAFSAKVNDEKGLEMNTGEDGTSYYSLTSESLADTANYYNILTIASSVDGSELTTSIPIPVSWNDSSEYLLSGPSRVSYDATTSKPSTSNNTEAYVLYQKDDKGNITKVEDKVKFELWYITDDGCWVSSGEENGFVENTIAECLEVPPTIDTTNSFRAYGEPTLIKGSSYYLRPAGMYVSNSADCVVVARIDGKCVFAQPILVYVNRWSSSLLNNWDGSLTVDEENNHILASMLGAGVKNSDNSFSMVALGDLTKISDGTSVVGLYGYHKSEPAFGFKVDGTAFLGKNGGGQISFDGNSGSIQSGNYKVEDGSCVDGMKIDLESGTIDSSNFKFDSHKSKDGEDFYHVNIESSAKTIAEGYEKCPNTFNFKYEKGKYYEKTLDENGNEAYTLYNGESYPTQKPLYKQVITYTYEELDKETIVYENNGFDDYLIKYEDTEAYYWIYRGDKKGYQKYGFQRHPTYYSLYKRIVNTSYEKIEEDAYDENGEYFEEVVGEDGELEYKKYNGTGYPEKPLLYKKKLTEVPKGFYHLRFKNNGELELSIANKTKLADFDQTFEDYTGNVDDEFTSIKDDVISVPGSLKPGTVYNYLDKRVETIEDEVLGIPKDTQIGNVYDYIKGQVAYIENEVVGLPQASRGTTSLRSYVDAQAYLTSEEVFNGLTENGKQKGLFFKTLQGDGLTATKAKTKEIIGPDGQISEEIDYGKDGKIVYEEDKAKEYQELYINASYIRTGILTSENWKGTLTYSLDGNETVYETVDQARVAVAKGEASFDTGKWSLGATAGTYWDLNNGKMWAANFELNAWRDDDNNIATGSGASGLYINSDPGDGQYYLSLGRIGIENKPDTYIQYKSDGTLDLKLSNFILDALTRKIDENGVETGQGIYLNSNPGSDESYFWIGNENNFVRFTKQEDNDEFIIQIGDNGSYHLNAWDNDKKTGIYINNSPENNETPYFRAGSLDGGLLQISNDKVQVVSKNFALDAWDSDNNKGLYLNSNPKAPEDGDIDYYLSIGGSDGFIQLDNNYGLSISSKNFVLDALTRETNEEGNIAKCEGIYLNSNPGSDESYFWIGNENSHLSFDTNNNLVIDVNNFTLQNKDEQGNVLFYLSSTDSKTDTSLIDKNTTTAIRLSICPKAKVLATTDSDYLSKVVKEANTVEDVKGFTIFHHSFVLECAAKKCLKTFVYRLSVITSANVDKPTGVIEVKLNNETSELALQDSDTKVTYSCSFSDENDSTICRILVRVPYDTSQGIASDASQSGVVVSSTAKITYTYISNPEDAYEKQIWLGEDGTFFAKSGKIGPFYMNSKKLSVLDNQTNSTAFDTELSSTKMQSQSIYGRWISCAPYIQLKFVLDQNSSLDNGFFMPFGDGVDTIIGITKKGIHKYSYNGQTFNKGDGNGWAELLGLYNRVNTLENDVKELKNALNTTSSVETE